MIEMDMGDDESIHLVGGDALPAGGLEKMRDGMIRIAFDEKSAPLANQKIGCRKPGLHIFAIHRNDLHTRVIP